MVQKTASMGKFQLTLPKLGEGVIEATILKWVKQPGDPVAFDDTIVEIATDKVDSEVPSPVNGTLVEIRFNENDVVPVGEVIAVIETEGEDHPAEETQTETSPPSDKTNVPEQKQPSIPETEKPDPHVKEHKSFRFYSPLVRSIADKEGVSLEELEQISGSGENGRIIRKDIEAYLQKRKQGPVEPVKQSPAPKASASPITFPEGNFEIVEMDRMRKLIADYMVESKRIAPHVTSMVEADVTNIVNWRKRNKDAFFDKYNQKLTFTPIFIQAIVRAIKDFPMINVSVDGARILVKKNINIGMAVALPSGNLIVPVIKNADMFSLAGLTTAVNDLAERARNSQLKPDEITGGTYTLTNLGSFGNLIGTPIINQPQVAIMATGAIRKKPAVLETPDGDVIAIRQMMYLSHAYDHRVVDGFLGGSFVRRVADYLEQFDVKQPI
jgi:2-oxoglutarate dehydrogenase E2 component (dihydrolipoamide succinyltransferase)